MASNTHVFDIDEPEKLHQQFRFTDRIKFAFGRTGLSVREIASHLGVSVQAIYKMCRGESVPSIGMNCKISDLCNVKLHFLLFGEGEP